MKFTALFTIVFAIAFVMIAFTPTSDADKLKKLKKYALKALLLSPKKKIIIPLPLPLPMPMPLPILKKTVLIKPEAYHVGGWDGGFQGGFGGFGGIGHGIGLGGYGGGIGGGWH